jgi:hypothetical protein
MGRGFGGLARPFDGVSYGRLYRFTGISPTGSTKSGTDYDRPYQVVDSIAGVDGVSAGARVARPPASDARGR